MTYGHEQRKHLLTFDLSLLDYSWKFVAKSTRAQGFAIFIPLDAHHTARSKQLSGIAPYTTKRLPLSSFYMYH